MRRICGRLPIQLGSFPSLAADRLRTMLYAIAFGAVLLSRFCNQGGGKRPSTQSSWPESVNNKNGLSRLKHNCGLNFF